MTAADRENANRVILVYHGIGIQGMLAFQSYTAYRRKDMWVAEYICPKESVIDQLIEGEKLGRLFGLQVFSDLPMGGLETMSAALREDRIYRYMGAEPIEDSAMQKIAFEQAKAWIAVDPRTARYFNAKS